MNIHLKNAKDLQGMRQAGAMAAEVLDAVSPMVQAGVTTEALDAFCHAYIVDQLKAYPAPLGYRGYPKSICTSINQVVCHGIPSKTVLKEGDIINIDVTVLFEGYHGDCSRMFEIHPVSSAASRLCEASLDALYLAIQAIGPGKDIRLIGQTIQAYARFCQYSVVEDFCGHGIGTVFHEPDLQILHYDRKWFRSQPLLPGMTFTIEPMINSGKKGTHVLKDHWTAVTSDGSLSAQWEHTLAITEDGVEIFTLGKNEEIRLSPRALAFKSQ